MKYYINGRFLTQKTTGVQRYAREMLLRIDEFLSTSNEADEWKLLHPRECSNLIQLKNIECKECGRLSGHLWEQIELPFYSRDGFLLNFCNCAPVIKKNQIVTIHDAGVLSFPEAYTWKFRLWYVIMYKILGKRLKCITTVSEFSAKELCHFLQIPIEKIYVTYNGIEHIGKIVPDENIIRKLDIHNKYVLAVSSRNKAKNFKLIIKSAKLLQDISFVIVGGMSDKVFDDCQLDNIQNVRYAGYVTDAELVALYKNAVVFLYPSLYEGFGIPPLEAMSNECPVIVSRCASLPEICGDAALFCDESDPYDLSKKILEVMHNESLRGTLIKKGKKRAEEYSWHRESKKYLDVILNKIGQKKLKGN